MECRSSPKCYKTAKYSDVVKAVITALEFSELPNLMVRRDSKDGDAVNLQKKLLERLERQLEDLRQQEEKQYDLLETGIYTQALFSRRNAVLRQRMDECITQIKNARVNMPKSINYDEKIATLKQAIDLLKDPDASVEQQNQQLKLIVERIEYSTGESSYNNTTIMLDITLRL